MPGREFFVKRIMQLVQMFLELKNRYFTTINENVPVMLINYMKDDIIEGFIKLMTMPIPVRGANMHFNGSEPFQFAYPNTGIMEVGARFCSVIITGKMYSK